LVVHVGIALLGSQLIANGVRYGDGTFFFGREKEVVDEVGWFHHPSFHTCAPLGEIWVNWLGKTELIAPMREAYPIAVNSAVM
jgi:hypothetical protein